jgi:hypothetical protein
MELVWFKVGGWTQDCGNLLTFTTFRNVSMLACTPKGKLLSHLKHVLQYRSIVMKKLNLLVTNKQQLFEQLYQKI